MKVVERWQAPTCMLVSLSNFLGSLLPSKLGSFFVETSNTRTLNAVFSTPQGLRQSTACHAVAKTEKACLSVVIVGHHLIVGLGGSGCLW